MGEHKDAHYICNALVLKNGWKLTRTKVVAKKTNVWHTIVATPNKWVGVLVPKMELNILLIVTNIPLKVKPHHRVGNYVYQHRGLL
jgi:hypothetical protein